MSNYMTPATRNCLRIALAEYEAHRERAGEPDGDPDASWWYAAWAGALIPVLRELAAEGGIVSGRLSAPEEPPP